MIPYILGALAFTGLLAAPAVLAVSAGFRRRETSPRHPARRSVWVVTDEEIREFYADAEGGDRG